MQKEEWSKNVGGREGTPWIREHTMAEKILMILEQAMSCIGQQVDNKSNSDNQEIVKEVMTNTETNGEIKTEHFQERGGIH